MEQRSRLSPLDSDEPVHPGAPQLVEEPVTTTPTGGTVPEPATGDTARDQTALTAGDTEGQQATTVTSRSPVAEGSLDSVAGLLGPATPPHVAAALRCIEQGRTLLLQGRAEAAREWFERALTLDGNNVYAYYFLARTALHTGRLDQAEAFLARALTLSNQATTPWQSRILSLRGEVFEGVGRFPEARQAYRDAAALDPNNSQARAGLARLSGSQ